MLTINLWSSVGLCNWRTGTVVDIIYQNNHQPPDLPITVIVEFENYRGPVFNSNQPLCTPICPGQSLPALPIHKSQGLALPKA